MKQIRANEAQIIRFIFQKKTLPKKQGRAPQV